MRPKIPKPKKKAQKAKKKRKDFFFAVLKQAKIESFASSPGYYPDKMAPVDDIMLANYEANYTFCLGLYRKAPTEQRFSELARKQVLIDELRIGLRLSTRWYRRQEISDFEEDEDSLPTEPREPLDIPEDDSETKWREETKWVKVGKEDFSLTLDALIEKLQAMRDQLGGNVPVAMPTESFYDKPVRKVLEQNKIVMII